MRPCPALQQRMVVVCCALILAPVALAQARPGDVVQQAYLKASNPDDQDHFGVSMAVSGDTMVIGATGENSSATGVNGDQFDEGVPASGAAYVFVRSGTSWIQQAYLKPSSSDINDAFGNSVAISGDTVVVGAPFEDSVATGVDGDQADNSANSSGAAYVFVRNGTTWSQQAYLKASNSHEGAIFGLSVAASGDTVVIGAIHEHSGATGVNGDQSDDSAVLAGAAYVFVRDGMTWSQQAYLKASNTDLGDEFGISVDAARDTVVVGAWSEDSSATGVDGDASDDGAKHSGAAYVFVRTGTTWHQQAYLKASNTDTGDRFGIRVSVSGDTIAVGAQGEDSNATGVNGDQTDDSANESGAAYVYVRNGGTWSQQAYLKGSNAEINDRFGGTLDVSQDTLVVTAYNEDSSATGIDGDQDSQDAPLSGAAYVFERNGSDWCQQAYLKASNTEQLDRFGLAVELSDDTVLVASLFESSSSAGANGDQNDNSATAAGAVYVFDLAAWADMGSALQGIAGAPVLVGTGPLADDSANAIGLSYAAPNAPSALFVATSSAPIPFKGGSLLPFPPLVAPILMLTDAAGTLSLIFRTPSGLPSSTALWMQFAVLDPAASEGVSLSNAIVGSTP